MMMASHRPRRGKASTYYYRYALTSRERRRPRGDLGLHRLPDLRFPSLTRRAEADLDAGDWQDDEDFIEIPVKVRPGPRHPAVTLILLLFLLVVAFICMIPLLGVLRALINSL